jgi:transposase InsO family protein
LGIEVAQSTVAKYLGWQRKPPSQPWRTFLANHMEQMASIDFFTVPTATFRVLFVFVVLSHARGRVVHFHAREHPTREWIMQQLREAFPWDQAPRYLLRDRDAIYGSEFAAITKGMGAEEAVTAPRAPWQDPFVERLVGSIRRECLDHIMCGTRDRCAGPCKAILLTSNNPGRTYRWARTRQSVVRFNRQQWVGPWKFLKLAACITSTRAKLPDRSGLPNASVRMQNTPYAPFAMRSLVSCAGLLRSEI